MGKTVVIIDLANVGKTLAESELELDLGKTLRNITRGWEIIITYVVGDFQQHHHNDLQRQYYDLGAYLVQAPKFGPDGQTDDTIIKRTINWCCQHVNFDAFHLLSGDGHFCEILKAARWEHDKHVFVLGGGHLNISHHYHDVAEFTDELAVVKKVEPVHENDDIDHVRQAYAHIKRFIELGQRPDELDQYMRGSTQEVQAAYALIKRNLKEMLTLCLDQKARRRLCGFLYIVDCVSDRTNTPREVVKEILAGAIDIDLFRVKKIKVTGGARDSWMPRLVLFHDYFDTMFTPRR